jgi:hypothetical protein
MVERGGRRHGARGCASAPAIAAPALEVRKGALDRPPDSAAQPVPDVAGGIEPALAVAARHDAIRDAAPGRRLAIPPAS